MFLTRCKGVFGICFLQMGPLGKEICFSPITENRAYYLRTCKKAKRLNLVLFVDLDKNYQEKIIKFLGERSQS